MFYPLTDSSHTGLVDLFGVKPDCSGSGWGHDWFCCRRQPLAQCICVWRTVLASSVPPMCGRWALIVGLCETAIHSRLHMPGNAGSFPPPLPLPPPPILPYPFRFFLPPHPFPSLLLSPHTSFPPSSHLTPHPPDSQYFPTTDGGSCVYKL